MYSKPCAWYPNGTESPTLNSAVPGNNNRDLYYLAKDKELENQLNSFPDGEMFLDSIASFLEEMKMG